MTYAQPTKFPLSYKPIPPYPRFWSSSSLIDYLDNLGSLSHVRSGVRLSNEIGLVSEMVRDLLRPTNPSTRSFLSTTAFNLGLRYFLSVRDIESARYLLYTMDSANIKKDLSTAHHVLYSLGCPQTPEDGSLYPVPQVEAVLRMCETNGIRTTNETWNLVMRAMPMGFGKSFVLEEMERRNIPVSSLALNSCVMVLLEKKGLQTTLDYLEARNQSEPLALSTKVMVLDHALKHESAMSVCKRLNLYPSVAVLDVFLRHLSNKMNILGQFGVLSLMESQGVRPGSSSFEYLFKTLRCGPYNPPRALILGSLIARCDRENVVLGVKARRYLRQAYKHLYKFRVCDGGPGFWDAQSKGGLWDADGPRDYTCTRESRRAAGLLGYGPDARGARSQLGWCPRVERPAWSGGLQTTQELSAAARAAELDPRSLFHQRLEAVAAAGRGDGQGGDDQGGDGQNGDDEGGDGQNSIY